MASTYSILTGGHVSVEGGDIEWPELGAAALQFILGGQLLEFLGSNNAEWAEAVAEHVARIPVQPYAEVEGGTLYYGAKSLAESLDATAHTLVWRGETSSVYFYLEAASESDAKAIMETFAFRDTAHGPEAVPTSLILIPESRPPNLDLSVDGVGGVSITEASRTAAPVNPGLPVAGGEFWYDEDDRTFVLRSATAHLEATAVPGTLAESVAEKLASVTIEWHSTTSTLVG